MQKKLYILVTLLLLQCSPYGGWGAFAQTYPVTISTQLTQPSPIYLSNYANTTSINSPIKVQLILNDLTIMNRQVRLKCYFQGAVSFVSNDFVVGATPIYLEGGFPTQLTNVELGPYFEYQNLQGVNPNQYAQPLPEGIYTLSFEVYDFATNKKLSKKSSVTTIIFQNEPPFLNLPVNKAEIVEQNIQNIIFSWTPRSINVSNVEYEFSLVEIWNTNTPLQNAFAYSQPLYTTTTRNTTVQYSITEPQLIPGKTYAWRVKAKALVGAEEIGVFKNNGYSEIFSFKYLTFCKAPLAITTTDVSQDQAKVTWSGEVDNYDYQINYREKNADSKWYPLVTPREYATISNLKPKTTYEYTVGAACDPGEYTHSNIQEFTTLAQDEIAFVGCGIKPDPAALSNKTPLPALFPNDVVTAGDFPIVVLKSTGSNGTFSGEGYVTLPFLEKFKELIDAADALGGDKVNIGKYSRIRITFNNIGINSDFKLISGEIVASYDKNWGGMVDGDKLLNPIIDKIEDLFENLYNLLKQKEEGTITKADFDKEWYSEMTIAQDKYKEILNDDIPEEFRKKVKDFGPIVNEVASTTYESAIPNTREKVGQLENIIKEYQELLALDAEILKKLATTLQSFGTDIFIKCTICDSNTIKTTSTIDSSQKFSIIKQKTKQYLCLIASIKDNKIAEYIPFNSESDINTEDAKTLIFYDNIKPVFFSKEGDILALINAQQQVTTCKVVYPFDAKFCENKIITDAITKNITTELQQCFLNELETITKSLVSFKTNSRSNQGIEFAYNGKVYELDGNLKLIEVKDPLSDKDIQNGNWTNTAIDVKIRFTKNSLGVFQYKAFGFRSRENKFTIAKIKNSEGVFEQKEARLKELSEYIKDKSNAFFSLNNAFTTPEKTPKQAGLHLNDGETYADGKKLEIDDNSGFFKISSEGIGLVTTLLKEGTVEEKTYLNTPPEGTVIKAPGLVTGSVEVVATKVTDLTTLATGVYDLTTDKEARSEAYKGLVKIKESIGNDATTFIPILADVLLSAFSGNTTQDWKSLKESNTDEGKKSHLFTRGAENTVISALAGVAFVKELPQMAEKVSEKIGKVKTIINSLKRFDIEGEFARGKNLVENTIVWGSKNFKMKWERIGNKISFGDRSDLAKILGTTDNIEAHHIMPWKVCEDNEIVQLAALDGFHPNLVENGLGLEKYSKLIGEGLHGNHPAYDAYLRDRLAKYASKNPNITPEQANKFLQVELIPEMKTYISNAKQSNLNLNEYFKQVVNKNTGIKGY